MKKHTAHTIKQRFSLMKNCNTAGYWDQIWIKEGARTWRVYPKLYELIAEIVGTNKEVLDVGCGAGILLKKLHDNKNMCYGVDISAEAIHVLQEEFRIPGKVARVPPIPHDDDCFDFVVGTEVLEHFNKPEAVIKEFKRVGGRSIFSVPDCDYPGNSGWYEHYQNWTRTTFKQFLGRFYSYVEIIPVQEGFTAPGRDLTTMYQTLLAVCEK